MILILRGLPGAGKSRFRTEWISVDPMQRAAINYDELREGMFGPGWKFNYDDEAKMKAEAMIRARALLDAKIDVCIDNTNLQERHYEKWLQLAKEYNVPVEVKFIDTPLHVCVDQDRRRLRRVGRAVIEGMALRNGLIDWSDYSLYHDDPIVIVDVDGTLADLSHRRPLLDVRCSNPDCKENPPAFTKKGACAGAGCNGTRTKKDYDKFFAEAVNDTPFQDIIALVHLFENQGFMPIVVSGRPDDKCGIITEDWLRKYGIPFEHLFMRRGGDYRPDDEVKKEILGFLPKNRISYVLDDRDRVVKMWRAEGLRVLQVAEGAF